MALWITHLLIACNVMEEMPGLDKKGFYLGNIAPDCNIENKDWTSFTPSRKVTHWISGSRKNISDCEAFYEEYIINRKSGIKSEEQYSFLLGYYTHLITDAVYQKFLRDEKRVEAVWERIKSDKYLKEQAMLYKEDLDSVKKLIPKQERFNEIYAMEAEHLEKCPDSEYIATLCLLKEFPDYIDYMPHGCIVRKINIMWYWPEINKNIIEPVAISRKEYSAFIDNTTAVVIHKLKKKTSR